MAHECLHDEYVGGPCSESDPLVEVGRHVDWTWLGAGLLLALDLLYTQEPADTTLTLDQCAAEGTTSPDECEVEDTDSPSACPPDATNSSQGCYCNTEQSYTATCPYGYTGDPVTKTVAADTIFSGLSQEDADAKALALAKALAIAEIVCELLYGYDPLIYPPIGAGQLI